MSTKTFLSGTAFGCLLSVMTWGAWYMTQPITTEAGALPNDVSRRFAFGTVTNASGGDMVVRAFIKENDRVDIVLLPPNFDKAQ